MKKDNWFLRSRYYNTKGIGPHKDAWINVRNENGYVHIDLFDDVGHMLGRIPPVTVKKILKTLIEFALSDSGRTSLALDAASAARLQSLLSAEGTNPAKGQGATRRAQ